MGLTMSVEHLIFQRSRLPLKKNYLFSEREFKRSHKLNLNFFFSFSFRSIKKVFEALDLQRQERGLSKVGLRLTSQTSTVVPCHQTFLGVSSDSHSRLPPNGSTNPFFNPGCLLVLLPSPFEVYTPNSFTPIEGTDGKRSPRCSVSIFVSRS